MAGKTKKTCFVICPIGAPDSRDRAWSDDIYKGLIAPMAEEFGFDARRSIDDSSPGDITAKVIKDVMEADLVVADLTFHNGNCFYELALRHFTGMPFIQVAAAGTKIPFDITTLNTVSIDTQTFTGMERTRAELRKHFQAVVDGSAIYENPVSRYREKVRIEETGSPMEKEVAALRDQLGQVTRDLAELKADSVVPVGPINWDANSEDAARQAYLDQFYRHAPEPIRAAVSRRISAEAVKKNALLRMGPNRTNEPRNRDKTG